MRYAIVTGSSRGLGEAIVRHLLAKNVIVFTISRSRNTELEEIAKKSDTLLYPFSYDLSNFEELEELMNEIFSLIDLDCATAIYLINNAGTIDPIKPVERAELNELVENVNVNLLAPMLIVSSFLKRCDDVPCDKRIINISSGAGKKPYFGWGAYCTAKAGIDMFTRCVAVEQEEKEFPVKIISFSPNVINTTMQCTIRNTKEEDFTQRERFQSLKKDGKLHTPAYVAKSVIELLESNSFLQGGIIQIDDTETEKKRDLHV